MVLNPGQAMDPGYFGIGNALFVGYEGPAATFFDAPQIATTRASYHRRTAALVYETSPSDYADVLLQAQSQQFGALYLTDDMAQPNPWDSSPAYFEQLVRAVEQSCTRTVSGSTDVGNTPWQQYRMTNGALDPNGLFVDVDTSQAGFARTPTYVISLGGNTRHWTTTGGSSVYAPTPTGFRVYIKATEPVTPQSANSWQWRIQWIASGL